METEKLQMVGDGVITTHPTSVNTSPGQVAKNRIHLLYIWQMITLPLHIEWTR